MATYDAIVIGTGQAGPSLARRLAAARMQVAIIERGRFGGTCVNTGCVPTKTLVASVKMVDALTRAGKPYDLVVLPEQTHRLEGGSLEYVREAVRRYFTEHLKP